MTRIFLAFCLMLPVFSYAGNSAIENITLNNQQGVTRLQVSLNQSVNHKIFALSKPDRLVLDFEDANLKTKLKSIALVNPDIKIIRSGNPKPHILRAVIEMKASLKSYKVVSEKHSKQIVIDLISPFNKNVAKHPNIPNHLAKQELPKQISSPKPNLSQVHEQPSLQGAVSAAKQSTNAVTAKMITPNKKRLAQNNEALPVHSSLISKLFQRPSVTLPQKRSIVIVLDPGHGGKDPGAVGIKGTKEKDVVLAIAKNLARLLNQQPHIHAVLTREGDYFVSLRNRIKLARKGKADLFVAIHADSYFDKNSHGVSVFALSQRGATSEAARWLAKRDNDSELGGVDLSELDNQNYLLRSVLIDLSQTATINDSLRLGNVMLDSLFKVTNLHYRRVEQARFVVLKSPDIPSVLVETGFISNSHEELRLGNQDYQTRIANALFEGIHQYSKKFLM